MSAISTTLNEPPTQTLSAQPAASNQLNFNPSTSRIREQSTFLLFNFWAHGPGTHISLTNYLISIGIRGVYCPLSTRWLVLSITYVQPFVEPFSPQRTPRWSCNWIWHYMRFFSSFLALCVGPFGWAVADLLILRFFSAPHIFCFSCPF